MEDAIIETSSGKLISLENPKHELIDPYDIAVALSRIGRFVGHIGSSQFAYSVAQHSVYCYRIAKTMWGADKYLLSWSLLHDAHEAYIGDISRPLATILDRDQSLTNLKDKFDAAICKRFGIETIYANFTNAVAMVNVIDEQAMRDEVVGSMKCAGRSKHWNWSESLRNIPVNPQSDVWSPERAQFAFETALWELQEMGIKVGMVADPDVKVAKESLV